MNKAGKKQKTKRNIFTLFHGEKSNEINILFSNMLLTNNQCRTVTSLDSLPVHFPNKWLSCIKSIRFTKIINESINLGKVYVYFLRKSISVAQG